MLDISHANFYFEMSKDSGRSTSVLSDNQLRYDTRLITVQSVRS